jgi:hypothetical protein
MGIQNTSIQAGSITNSPAIKASLTEIQIINIRLKLLRNYYQYVFCSITKHTGRNHVAAIAAARSPIGRSTTYASLLQAEALAVILKN